MIPQMTVVADLTRIWLTGSSISLLEELAGSDVHCPFPMAAPVAKVSVRDGVLASDSHGLDAIMIHPLQQFERLCMDMYTLLETCVLKQLSGLCYTMGHTLCPTLMVWELGDG
jgi:hypothetical protein|mmetsp:Transcript_64998/g.107945  ORF Transcript_64998/g.107945 Transcript_64998/m.107945 type:complete len:113 (-) Transcript_64998:566-904(-)|eukprot:CAMPEP_0174300250 /NCGR_PEP_ID=MMETSP0809-20121228/58354_1 /TAXON_ID=73025 ORGANISM="Eutreptiella gymnastica-like, Strain CCMP1594" /NCGR_SAMPLE_ID=MMETSP0809 /ASSEMBLY_ACC=CAM_ASM_000658 /LENGTH=112 /DNA_ID=CAMNT_0015405801 /DNA_START=1636 /DNA_END=1974 /DNA_ORIENTATION=+